MDTERTQYAIRHTPYAGHGGTICCCCCCSQINSHNNQVRGHRTGSSHSGTEEYLEGRTQTIQFVYFGGAITADRDLSIEITRRLQRVWACFQRYKMEIIYDRPGVRLRLKVRLLKAEVLETLIYGRMTWSPKKPDYDRLRRVHRSMLLRCLGWRKRERDDHTFFFFFFFFFSTLSLSSFWTSRGHRCHPFSSPVLAFNFYRAKVQQSHCSSIVHRVLLTHALALSASQLVHKK